MDLVILDEDMQPGPLVEGYDSLIWNEKFNTVSDFQITTGDRELMSRLPEGTLLSLRESNIVMQVETHNPLRKKNQPEVITIKGRGWESILDRRVAISAVVGGIADWAVVAKIPSDVAYFIIEKICVEGILDPADIFEPDKVQFPTPADYLTSTGPNRQFSVPKGNLLSAVLPLLQVQTKEDLTTTPVTPAVVPHGIRAVRPDTTGTAVSIEIYTGVDRTDKVYFDAQRGLLDDGQYFFSKIGSADVAYILAKASAAKLSKRTATPTGLDRRVILVDATTSGMSDEAALQAQGEISLAAAKETAIFDGAINQDLSTYTYGVDYGLGDIVRLVGDYGIDQKARVTEYIRAEDKTGYKAYPTLTTIDD